MFVFQGPAKDKIYQQQLGSIWTAKKTTDCRTSCRKDITGRRATCRDLTPFGTTALLGTLSYFELQTLYINNINKKAY